jgi:transcriptional regulator with XRE-family HTH domain
MTATTARAPVGDLLRGWRQRRHLSQLDLAGSAEVSARHLSFVENGRSKPSRELLLHLAVHLDVPVRDRNALLVAAGYAPAHRETPFDADAMTPVREAVTRIVDSNEPFPALVVDRTWNIVAANRTVSALLSDGVAPALLDPPVNAMRVSLHPDGLARRIENYGEWRAHLLHRLTRQVALSGDRDVAALLDEVRAYPAPAHAASERHDALDNTALFVPLRLRRGELTLSFLSTIATFGTALDVTVAELSIEQFFPADESTAAALHSAL